MPVTLTLTVHELAPAVAFTPVPPMENVPVPAVAVSVGAPPQPFTTLGTAAITTPAGSVSLKVRLLRAGDPAGFEIVKVSVLDWPTPMVDGAKAFVSAGSDCTTRPEAVAALVTRAVPLMLAAALVYGPPTTLEVTSTVAATTTLAGSVSMKLMPLCAGLPAPLASVNVSVDVPPCAMVVGAKALSRDACTTVSVWLVTPLARTPPTVTFAAPFT